MPVVAPETRALASVAGVAVDTWPLAAVVPALMTQVRERLRGYVCVASIHGLVVANQDADFQETMARAAWVVPDGMPLVWAARLQGFAATEQITGYELVHALSAALAGERRRVFYYGGPPGLAERMARTLESRYPGLQTAGYHAPPFRPLDEHELQAEIDAINATHPDVVWVGLPTPKQERWMRLCLPRLECTLAAGVGAAFDFVSGNGRLPPRFYRRLGLGWLHRIAQSPSYWRRYAYIIPRFGLYFARHWIHARQASRPPASGGVSFP